MSSALINDWLDFCDGKSDFDSDHFFTLFMGELSESDLEKIFSKMPVSRSFLDGVLSVKSSARYAVSKGVDRKNEVVSLVKDDMAFKREVCEKVGEDELVDFFSSSEIVFVGQEKFELLKDSDEVWPNFECMELVGDFLSDRVSFYDKKISALTEAFYGFTGDYNLVWYLMSPVYDYSGCSDAYFRLWASGVEFLVAESAVFVLDRNRIDR